MSAVLYYSGCAHLNYPTEIIYGLFLNTHTDMAEIPLMYPYCGEWGKPQVIEISDNKVSEIPSRLSIMWFSITECKYFSQEIELPKQKFVELSESLESITPLYVNVGMALYGGLAVWLYSYNKAKLLVWDYAKELDNELIDLMDSDLDHTIKERYKNYFERNGNDIPLLPRSLFEKYMQQFIYRYQVIFGLWNDEKKIWGNCVVDEDVTLPEFDYIEEALFDGTHDKLHDGGLMNYHQAGKTKKLAVKWHINKSEYTAYFWFEDEEIRAIFDRFYGAHPETKTDFMIRIDSDNKKFELALYRYGLKEPQVISESAYQLLVFKNKFEYYRSENYNQPRGAWIW